MFPIRNNIDEYTILFPIGLKLCLTYYIFLIGNNIMQIGDCLSLGRFVRAQRRTQQLTQAEAAGLSGVGIRFIHDLERGKPTVHLGKVLDVLLTLGIRVHLEDGDREGEG